VYNVKCMHVVNDEHVVNDDEKCSVEYPKQLRDLEGREI